MFGICLGYVGDMFGICLGYVWDAGTTTAHALLTFPARAAHHPCKASPPCFTLLQNPRNEDIGGASKLLGARRSRMRVYLES